MVHHAGMEHCRRRVRQVIERIEHDGRVTAVADRSSHHLFPVAMSTAEGAVLAEWIVSEGAARTIEIGLGYGIAALFACEGLLRVGSGSARHVAIDPFQRSRFADVALQLLDEAGVADMVELHRHESQLVLPRLVNDGSRFDVAVVDGNHRFDRVFVDLYFLNRLLRPGGIVFLDDLQLPAVARASAFFVTNLDWRRELVSGDDPFHQWAVLRTGTEPDRRPFTHFVDF